MNLMWRLLLVGIRGAVLGAVLAAAMGPQDALTAEEGCRCSDSGKGDYRCNDATHSDCLAGSETCSVDCS